MSVGEDSVETEEVLTEVSAAGAEDVGAVGVDTRASKLGALVPSCASPPDSVGDSIEASSSFPASAELVVEIDTGPTVAVADGVSSVAAAEAEVAVSVLVLVAAVVVAVEAAPETADVRDEAGAVASTLAVASAELTFTADASLSIEATPSAPADAVWQRKAISATPPARAVLATAIRERDLEAIPYS